MEIRLVMKTARSVSLELDDGGIYKTKRSVPDSCKRR